MKPKGLAARASAVELEKLEEMLREQERAFRFQVRGLEEEDGKSLRMIQLSIAALAGGVALSTVLLRTPSPVPSLSVVWIAMAAGLNLLALVIFVDAYVGFSDPSDAYVGPTPAWIAERVEEPTWTLEDHLVAQIERNPSFFQHNLSIVEDATQRRRRGIYLLLSALFAYAGGYIYILSEVMMT